MSDNKILQPYIRRRAFNKIHVQSWLIYLEKDGFVRCSFQNCNFMAFDAEEMCHHYGFCKGESSSAKYVCIHCNGRTVSMKKLQHHLSLAHNVSATEENSLEPEDNNPEPNESGKPSRVMQLMWQYFHEKHNYIKCSNCNYIANTVSDMCRHYPLCKQEMNLLMYVCPECKGRTMNVNPLLWHMERSHKIFRAPSQFNHITKTMIRFWKREIAENNYATCLHIVKGQRDCFYFDLDLLGIIEHSQSCKGPNVAIHKEQCPHCPMWTSSAGNLAHHIEVQHGELKDSGMIVNSTREVVGGASTALKEYGEQFGNRSSALSMCNEKKPFTIRSDIFESELSLDPQEEIVTTENEGFSNRSLEFMTLKEEIKIEETEEREREEIENNKVLLSDGKSVTEVKQQTQSSSIQFSNDQLELFAIKSPSNLVKDGSQPQDQNNKVLRKGKDQNKAFDFKESHNAEEGEEQILTIDLGEEVLEKEESRKESPLTPPFRPLGLTSLNMKSYKKTPSDKMSAIRKENLKEEFKNITYESLPGTSNKNAVCNDNRLHKNEQKPHLICKDGSGDENLILQDGKIPIMGKDLMGGKIGKKPLASEKEHDGIFKPKEKIEDINEAEKVEWRKLVNEPLKPSCYSLFKDEMSSDEDENNLLQEKTLEREGDEIFKTYSRSEKVDQACEKSLPKNYLKRPGSGKSIGMLPNKRPCTSSEQDMYLETGLNSEAGGGVTHCDLVTGATTWIKSIEYLIKTYAGNDLKFLFQKN